MRERIDIVVPNKILGLNEEKRERLEKTHQFAETDRTPVVVDMQLWGLLAGRGGAFSEMTRSPRDHLRGQILNWKYRYENIHDDLPINTDRLVIEQDFGAIRGAEFPIKVIFRGNDQPKSVHLLKSLEDIDYLEMPYPYDGYNKLRIDWYKAMCAMVGDFDVRLNGEPLEVEVTITHSGGPIPSAFALCGSNLFLWMALDPQRTHRLMEIVTQSHLNCLAYIDGLKGVTQKHSISLGCDAGELVSSTYFREFVAPYYRRVWECYEYPRNFHMCGKVDHLIDIFRDDLDITYLDGFGFPVDRQKLADGLAGRVVMRGGPHPVLIHDGPMEAIIDDCSDYIRKVGQRGGYILSEGFGIMAGTPPEHIEAMVEASRRMGWVGKTNM